jgi:excisionase family DNA binding protein
MQLNPDHETPAQPVRPRALRIAAAARYSGLSRSFIYVALGDGRLQGLKVGRSTLVLVESLDRLLDRLPRYDASASR